MTMLERAEAAERIKTEWNGDAIYLRTGTPVHPMSPLAKLVWLRHDRPELFARAAPDRDIDAHHLQVAAQSPLVVHQIRDALRGQDGHAINEHEV